MGVGRPVAAAAAAIIAALLVLAAPAAGEPPLAASLSDGQTAFWAGAHVESARVDDPSLCGIEAQCLNYPIRVVSSHSKTLRVAIDSTDESNGWQLRLLDPAGNAVASDTTYQEGGLGERLDVEVFAHNPVAGVWTAQVIPQNVQNGDFRVRAALGTPPLAPLLRTAPSAAATPSSRPATNCTSSRARTKTRRRARTRARRATSSSARHVRHHRARRCVSGTRRHSGASAPRATSAPRSAPQTPGVVDLLPDIAPDPPWHLTFAQPLPQVLTEGGNVTALGGLHNPVAQLAGEPVYACLPEETIEQGAHHCLRFSSGVASIGRGELEVYGSADVPVAVNGGPLYQVVQRSDGSSYSRAAGQFIFHHVHLHYHVLDLAHFPLYRVAPDHTLVPVGQGLKEGFCLGNLKIYDWSSFTQDEINPNSIDNCQPSAHPNAETNLPDGTWRFYEGVSTGWEDVYTWATSGQFVDFNTNPDGYYVLQMIVNPRHVFLESNYGNNVAYTYFRVTGNDVTVLERGRGNSPWDPNKVVLDPVITQ